MPPPSWFPSSQRLDPLHFSGQNAPLVLRYRYLLGPCAQIPRWGSRPRGRLQHRSTMCCNQTPGRVLPYGEGEHLLVHLAKLGSEWPDSGSGCSCSHVATYRAGKAHPLVDRRQMFSLGDEVSAVSFLPIYARSDGALVLERGLAVAWRPWPSPAGLFPSGLSIHPSILWPGPEPTRRQCTRRPVGPSL